MGDFTIQISKNLVDQLADDGQKVKRKIKKPKTKIPREPQQKATREQLPDDTEKPRGAAAPGWPLQPSLLLPVTPPAQSANAELEGIRSVLQESESVLEKLRKREEEMAREVTQRAKELREKEFKLPYQKPMPCVTELDACAECFKANANHLLKCSQVVNKYATCARKAKEQAH